MANTNEDLNKNIENVSNLRLIISGYAASQRSGNQPFLPAASDLGKIFLYNSAVLKDAAKKSFSRIYASLKARELKTLRQLEVLQKQFQCNGEANRNCVQNISISYENESSLLDNISKYGTLNIEPLHFDNSTFTLEDYVSPNEDHMYSYKCIKDLEAIEVAALKQITSPNGCVCQVNIHPEDVSKRFRDERGLSGMHTSTLEPSIDNSHKLTTVPSISTDNIHMNTESDLEDTKKVEPTEDWLNSIKSQTETEPSQADCLEHSQITCS